MNLDGIKKFADRYWLIILGGLAAIAVTLIILGRQGVYEGYAQEYRLGDLIEARVDDDGPSGYRWTHDLSDGLDFIDREVDQLCIEPGCGASLKYRIIPTKKGLQTLKLRQRNPSGQLVKEVTFEYRVY